MLFSLLNIIRHNILLIVVIIVALVYAGVNVPYIEELGELILKGVDHLSTYINLKDLVKEVQNAFNNVKKAL